MRITTICKRTKHLTMVELPLKALIIHRRMSNNPHFPDAAALLAELDVCRAAMQAANLACVNGGRLDTSHRHDSRQALDAALDRVYRYVRAGTQGDLQAALSSGFTLRKPPLPLPATAMPQAVELRRNRHSGALQLRWAPVHGAHIYCVEVKQGDVREPSGWRLLEYSSQAKLHITGLRSGETYDLRVRAVFAAGLSPYSSCVSGMVA